VQIPSRSPFLHTRASSNAVSRGCTVRKLTWNRTSKDGGSSYGFPLIEKLWAMVKIYLLFIAISLVPVAIEATIVSGLLAPRLRSEPSA
jgi:hypothetical protein